MMLYRPFLESSCSKSSFLEKQIQPQKNPCFQIFGKAVWMLIHRSRLHLLAIAITFQVIYESPLFFFDLSNPSPFPMFSYAFLLSFFDPYFYYYASCLQPRDQLDMLKLTSLQHFVLDKSLDLTQQHTWLKIVLHFHCFSFCNFFSQYDIKRLSLVEYWQQIMNQKPLWP